MHKQKKPADLSGLVESPDLHRREVHPGIDYVPCEKIRMHCNRTLAITAKPAGSDGRPHVVGYVAWRKRDNHKLLFVRAENGRLELWDKLPQRKRTDIPALAKLLGFGRDVTIALKEPTCFNGGRMAGGPIFRSTSFAGGFREL